MLKTRFCEWGQRLKIPSDGYRSRQRRQSPSEQAGMEESGLGGRVAVLCRCWGRLWMCGWVSWGHFSSDQHLLCSWASKAQGTSATLLALLWRDGLAGAGPREQNSTGAFSSWLWKERREQNTPRWRMPQEPCLGTNRGQTGWRRIWETQSCSVLLSRTIIFLHWMVTKAWWGLCAGFSATDHLWECTGGIYLGFLHFFLSIHQEKK